MSDTFNDFDPDDRLFNCYHESFGDMCSNYYSVSNFNHSFTDLNNDLTLCNYNIRSFNVNFDNFEGFLHALRCKLNLIVLTETRFSAGYGRDIGGYSGHHVGRVGGAGGGVSVYSDPLLRANKIDHLSFVNGNIESCVINFTTNHRNFTVVGIYRPPSGLICECVSSILEILNDECVCSREVLLSGDLNIDLVDYENSSIDVRNFVNSMYSLSFLPVITRPTRFPLGEQLGSPSILDHIWYNRCNAVMSGIFIFDTTDHLPTFIVLKDVFSSSHRLVEVKFRDKSLSNIEKFVHECEGLTFDLSTRNVNDNTEKFISALDDLYCKSFPLKVKYLSHKRLSKPWLTNGLLTSIKNKSKYYKLFKLNLISESFYKNYRNSLTNTIKHAKKTYYVSSFDGCRGDIRGTWRLLNDLMVRGRNSSNISSIYVDDAEISDPNEIANNFNSYFINVANRIYDNLPHPVGDPVNNIDANFPNSFFISPVMPSEVINVVHALKNSSYGLYSISTKLFKTVIHYLSVPLACIINDSIEQGVFPNILKRASVTPLFKSGLEKDFKNYRPISVLPLLSKVFEKCINSRLLVYLSDNNILNTSQFGFRRSMCTTDALVDAVEYIYEQLNLKNHTVGISLDFSKAFDTVSHEILLRKLSRYGIRGLALDWFGSYLSDRTQRVRVGDAFSEFGAVRSGVPQGSILGPILFLLYINDLPAICNNTKFTLFADDATLMVTNHDYNAMVDEASYKLSMVREWTINNILMLNADKTSLLLFTNRDASVNRSLINMCDVHLSFTNHVKFLGIIIDHKLNYSSHINSIASKLSRISGILYSIRNNVPEKILLNLYYSLVYPHLIYGILLWGDSADVHLEPLILIQKKIVRTITHSDYLAHTAPIFKRTRILCIKNIYKYFVGIHMYKLQLSDSLVYPAHNYSTRYSNNVIPSFQRLTQCLKSLTCNGPKIYNTIPLSIRNSQSLNVFKRRYREYLLVGHLKA